MTTSGLCECGCGLPTRVAPWTDASKGWINGQPLRFRYHHQGKVRDPRSLPERIWSQVDRSGPGCWEWQGRRDLKGYGRLDITSENRKRSLPRVVTRLVWEMLHGPIPEGLQVCHHCDNPPCCRPDHLWLGTNADNIKDGTAKGRGPGSRCGRKKLK